jgi:hypothetical protein
VGETKVTDPGKELEQVRQGSGLDIRETHVLWCSVFGKQFFIPHSLPMARPH